MPRRRRQGSLRSRLAAVLAVTVAVVVLVVAGATYLLTEHQLERGQDVALLREANRIQRLLQAGSPYVASGSDACRYDIEPACTRVVTTTDPVGPFDSALRITPAVLAVADGHQSHAFFTRPTSTGRVRVVTLPIRPGEAVMVGIPTTTVETTIDRIRFLLLVVGAVGIGLSALIGYLVATVGLRPVRLLAESVDRVSRSRDPRDGVVFGRDDETHRDDELGRLARSFTAMLRELDASNQAQRQLVADASHELRSPLTTLKTNITLLQRGGDIPDDTRRRLREAVQRELVGMQTLIGDLVDLARPPDRSSGDLRIGEAPVDIDVDDLDSLANEVVAAAARHWPTVEFGFARDSEARGLLIHAPPERVRRLLSVLLDNAGKYSDQGGPVELTVERHGATEENGAHLTLTVTDRGVGIDPNDLPHIFDRFFRSPSARRLSGSGLGLAIAAQIVAEADGTIIAAPRDGGGTMITVHLPSAGREHATSSSPHDRGSPSEA